MDILKAIIYEVCEELKLQQINPAHHDNLLKPELKIMLSQKSSFLTIFNTNYSMTVTFSLITNKLSILITKIIKTTYSNLSKSFELDDPKTTPELIAQTIIDSL